MIIDINGDYFAVKDDQFIAITNEFKDDPAILTEWIEQNGIHISGDDFLILEQDEVEAVIKELKDTWINKENQMYAFVLGKMAGFVQRGKDNARKSEGN